MRKVSRTSSWLLLLILAAAVCLSGCGPKNNQILRGEELIKMQINGKTYQNTTNEEVDSKFLQYFTEEAYKEYKDNYFEYVYPQLFTQTNAKSIEVKKIKCTSTTKESDGNNTYVFEVKYTIKSKSETLKLTDHLSFTMDAGGNVVKGMVLNTSDSMKRVFIDVKLN